MSDGTFTVAGTSVKNGVKKLRFANGKAEARETVLLKDNHSDVRLFDLPKPMSKEDATAWLEAQGDTVPVRESKPAASPGRPRAPKQTTVEVKLAAIAALPEDFSNDDGAKAIHASSFLGFMTWDELSRESRDEFRMEFKQTQG